MDEDPLAGYRPNTAHLFAVDPKRGGRFGSCVDKSLAVVGVWEARDAHSDMGTTGDQSRDPSDLQASENQLMIGEDLWSPPLSFDQCSVGRPPDHQAW